jgi:hypothetical protein
MNESSRGPVLTAFAIAFVVLAISNFMKPLRMSPDVGFVFFGVKTTGLANAILGPAFGVLQAVYAVGIWRMRRWALPIGYAYAAYVVVNLALYTILHAGMPGQPPPAFMLVYVVVAIGVSWGSAILLHRRRAHLA